MTEEISKVVSLFGLKEDFNKMKEWKQKNTF
jgi:hypothetical protein